MFLWLLILFVVVPLADCWLLFKMFQAGLGLEGTLVLVIATGMLGAALAKHQGLTAWRRVHEQLGRGELPGEALLDGILILLAATVLITPGVMTDLLGLALLVPPLRGIFRRPLLNWLKRRATVSIQALAPRNTDEVPPGATVIDAEFVQSEEEEIRNSKSE